MTEPSGNNLEPQAQSHTPEPPFLRVSYRRTLFPKGGLCGGFLSPSPDGYSYPQIPRKAQSRKNRNKSKKGNEKKIPCPWQAGLGPRQFACGVGPELFVRRRSPPLGCTSSFAARYPVAASCTNASCSSHSSAAGSPTLMIGVTLRCFKARLVRCLFRLHQSGGFLMLGCVALSTVTIRRLQLLPVEQLNVVQVFL